jgi:hypothetical protein
MISPIVEFIKKRQYKTDSSIKKSKLFAEIRRTNRYLINPIISLHLLDSDITTNIYIHHLSILTNMADMTAYIDEYAPSDLKRHPYYNYMIILLFLLNYNDVFRIARNNYMGRTMAYKSHILQTVKNACGGLPVIDSYMWLVILHYNYSYFTELGCCNRCFTSLLFPNRHVLKDKKYVTLTYSETIDMNIKEFIYNGIYGNSQKFDIVRQINDNYNEGRISKETTSTRSLDGSPPPLHSTNDYHTGASNIQSAGAIPDIPDIFVMSVISDSVAPPI